LPNKIKPINPPVNYINTYDNIENENKYYIKHNTGVYLNIHRFFSKLTYSDNDIINKIYSIKYLDIIFVFKIISVNNKIIHCLIKIKCNHDNIIKQQRLNILKFEKNMMKIKNKCYKYNFYKNENNIIIIKKRNKSEKQR
jgi:hypothetical protein